MREASKQRGLKFVCVVEKLLFRDGLVLHSWPY